jgi:hypothetical protein
MGSRRFDSSGALAVLIAVVALTPASLVGQNRTTAADAAKPAATKPWTPSRTADGQPDFQGVWRNNSATPLERPKALEGRQTLTDDEVAAMRNRAAQFRQNGSDFAPGDGLFLAALAGQEQYKNAQATCRLDISDDKVFDNRTSLIVDPPDGKIPPLTPAAQQRQRRAAGGGGPAGPEDLSNNMRCITYGVPRLGGNSADYGGYVQIFQSSGYFALLDEGAHESRIIPLDGRPHVPDSVRLWNGDSRGRWDGNTLVVDTTNFSPKSNFRGSAENLHLVERFTRVSPEMIHYELTLEDPTTWTKPWTAVVHLNLSHDKVYESACHEGNFDIVRDVLGAARVDEKAAAERAK